MANEKVRFRRVRGRIVPIREKRNKQAAGAAGLAAGALAVEASRRKTVKNTPESKIVRRRSIFTKTTTFTTKKKIGPFRIKSGFAKIKKVGRRTKVDALIGVDTSDNAAVMKNIYKEALRNKSKSIYGNIISNDLAEQLHKKGATLVRTSRSGTKRSSLPNAKAEITRLKKGKVRSIVTAIIKLR